MSQNNNLHSIRRTNLLRLINEFVTNEVRSGRGAYGVERKFAEQVQMQPSLLSQLKKSRPISDANARQIEACCKKRKGWLSSVPDTATQAPTFEVFSESEFIEAARSFLSIGSPTQISAIMKSMTETVNASKKKMFRTKNGN